MWVYDKKTEYPINIKKSDPRMAKLILTQYGGPNGELAASLRYLSQRYAMPNKESKAILTDIGTEELAHFEMIGTMISQLVKDVPPKELERMGFGSIYAIHGKGVYPSDSNGVPFTAAYIESMSDPITNLNEDMAAEQKARSTYEFLINMADDPDVIEPLRFLREREVVHYQRFGEALRIVQEAMRRKKMYYKPNNPAGLAVNPNPDIKDIVEKLNMANPVNPNPVSPLNIHNIPGPILPDTKQDNKKKQ